MRGCRIDGNPPNPTGRGRFIQHSPHFWTKILQHLEGIDTKGITRHKQRKLTEGLIYGTLEIMTDPPRVVAGTETFRSVFRDKDREA